MDKQTNIQEILDRIKLTEGETFGADQAAIVKEYHNNNSDQSGIAIKVLSIFGGILGTLAFIGFLLAAGLYNSEEGLVIFGLGFIVCSAVMNVIFDKLIIDTASIAIYVIGFSMLGFGLAGLHVDENIIYLIFILIAMAGLILIPNYIFAFISVLVITGSCWAMIVTNNVQDLMHLYIAGTSILLSVYFLNESGIITSGRILSRLYNPVRIALIFSLIAGLFSVGKKGLLSVSLEYVWLSSLVTIPIVLYLISTILQTLQVNNSRDKVIILSASLILLLPTAFSPAISGSMLILLLSFRVNYKTGLVIGIIFLIYFVSQYYYDLNFTLLEKSGILVASGIFFILFYLFTYKKLADDQKI